jgi:hypothetical protein
LCSGIKKNNNDGDGGKSQEEIEKMVSTCTVY